MLSDLFKKGRIRQYLKVGLALALIKMIIFAFILIIAGNAGCNKTEQDQPEYKTCLEEKIAEFEDQACDSEAKVREYMFQADTVYVFDPGLCGADMVSAVLNTECNVLGFLGGIQGNTEINGEEFSNAIYIRTIWEN